MNKIAIVAVAYNRVKSLARLLSSLEKSYYPSNNVTLIISVDKSNSDEVEKYAEDYIWEYGEKTVDKHEKNMGLRAHMLSLGKWFNQFDAIIVLEDDIVVSPNYYQYTMECVEKYYENHNIAGISLYSFEVNYLNNKPFIPIKDQYDVYFMNCAMSWGEVWMKNQWQAFYDWYKQHLDFPELPHIPARISLMGQKSWLKYHTRYCIEENKYFVFPHTALSTNYSDQGTHNSALSSVYQVKLHNGKISNFRLPDVIEQTKVLYDGYFENKSLYDILGYKEDELCLNLSDCNRNLLHKRFYLTTQTMNYKILSSYALLYRPIEENIFKRVDGTEIFLYDTSIRERNPYKNGVAKLLYTYKLSTVIPFLRDYGYLRLLKTIITNYSNRLLSIVNVKKNH